MSIARRAARFRRRYRYQLTDAAIILATLAFAVAVGAIGVWGLRASLNG